MNDFFSKCEQETENLFIFTEKILRVEFVDYRTKEDVKRNF